MKTPQKDLSKSQYIAAMRKAGWVPEFMGYWSLTGHATSVCALNGGPRRRDRLAYMLQAKERIKQEPAAIAISP